MPLFGGIELLYELDSATVSVSAREAAVHPRFRRTEEISDTLTSSFWRDLAKRRGWYFTSYGKNANGGYTLVLLDETERLLYVSYSPN